MKQGAAVIVYIKSESIIGLLTGASTDNKLIFVKDPSKESYSIYETSLINYGLVFKTAKNCVLRA